MTVDREQTRRDAEPRSEETARKWRSLGHSSVTEGVNLAYVDQMRRALYAAADAYDALLAELEQAERNFEEMQANAWTEEQRRRQAERERDEAREALAEWVENYDLLKTGTEEAEARLAKVPALVEALREIAAHGDDSTEPRLCYLQMIGTARDALAAWESEPESRATVREDTEATKGAGS